MSRPKKTDKAERLTITLPKNVRAALLERVNQTPDSSESGFVSELLTRNLNVGVQGGMAGRESETAERLRQILLSYFSDPRKEQSSVDDLTAQCMEKLKTGDYQNPGLLRSIPGFVAALMRNPRRFFGAMESSEVYIPKVDYSSAAIQSALQQLTSKWSSTRELSVNFKQITPAKDAFDAGVNLEFALSAQSLFLFPFFLSEFRRHSFGVIPYGKHIAIGWLVHKGNPLATSFDLKNDFKKHAMTMYSDDSSGARLQFLTELFTHASEERLRIFTKDNYLNREMLPLLKSNAQHSLLVSAFSERKSVETVPEFASAQKQDSPEKRVFLYDLASDSKTFSSWSDYLPVPFLHDQNIPVGIGFSIPALPVVARRIPSENRTVADALLEKVKVVSKEHAGKLAFELWQHGILLDDPFRFIEASALSQYNDTEFSIAMQNSNPSTK